MFGFFKKKFDVEKDVEFRMYDGATELAEVPEGGTLRLVTSGLAKWDRRELELVGVPAELRGIGAVLLRQVANYTVTGRRIEDRQTFAGAIGPFALLVRLFETESHGLAVSRIGDVLDAELPQSPPRPAIATLTVMLALAKQEQSPDEAKALLERSAAFFRGAGDAGPEGRVVGGGYNTENFLTYLALASVDSENRVPWLLAAFERSSEARRAELGVDELPEVSKEQLRRDTAQLVIALQMGAGGEAWGPERLRVDGQKGAEVMAMIPSPLVQRQDGGLVRFVSPLPVPFRRYFYESPVRERLRTDEILDVVAELYADLRENTPTVLALTAEIRELYRKKLEPTDFGTEGGEPELTMPMPGDASPQLPALSRLLADVGRLLAADLDAGELRAHYELTDDEAAQERARAKLSALEALEARYFGMAMGLDPGAL